MSGGVGPCDDIGLGKEPGTKIHDHVPVPFKPRTAATAAGLTTLRQINALVAISVLSASGMVPWDDLAFSVLSIIYFLFVLSRIAFPSSASATPSDTPLFGPKTTWTLRLYAVSGGVLGMILPLAYVARGIVKGDPDGVRAAAPHLFLLACQVFAEGLASGAGLSAPVRVLVPVFFTARRLLSLADWIRSEVEKNEVAPVWRRTRWGVDVGLALAVLNLLFWGFNLMGLLLPVHLPRALKAYYVHDRQDEEKKTE